MNSPTNSIISTLSALKIGGLAPIVIFTHSCLFYHPHPLPNFSPMPNFSPLLILHVVTMPKWYNPSSYDELLAIPELAVCREIFLRAGWGSFLACLQGHNDGVSLQFTLGFNGRMERMGSLAFLVSEESISSAMKLPQVGDHWFKNHQLPRPSYNRVFKPEF